MPAPTTPASPVPSSGAKADTSTAATGADLSDVTPTVAQPAAQLDESALMRAFLGEADEAPQGDTQPDAPDPDAAPDAGEEPAEDPEHPAATGGQLDHLIDALVKDPENHAIRKRVSKLLAEPAKLKSTIKELEAQVKEAGAPPVFVAPPSPNDPLAHVTTPAQLHTALSNAEAWEAWCEDHPDGGEVTPWNDESYLDADEVRARLRSARAQLRAAPAKQEWLKQFEQTRANLREHAPELFEKDSDLQKEVLAIFNEGRISPHHASHWQDAVDLVEGRRSRLEREQGITRIKLDPKTAAAKAAASSVSAPRPGPNPGTGTKLPATRPATAGSDLGALKQRAAKGDQAAQASLIDAFVGV